jgi:hypothetical protein
VERSRSYANGHPPPPARRAGAVHQELRNDVFDLRFETGPLVDWEGWPYAVGRITLGEHTEPFEASLEAWDPRRYVQQWQEQAARLVSGADRALCLTSFGGPEAAYHFGWPMWRFNDAVRVQQYLIIAEQLSAPLDPSRAESVVRDREAASEDGHPISEWVVDVEDVRYWLEQARGLYVPV